METFDLPVNYKGHEKSFKSQLLQFGFTHKIQVDVDGLIVTFEPDEERNYRCIIDPSAQDPDKVDKELIRGLLERQ